MAPPVIKLPECVPHSTTRKSMGYLFETGNVNGVNEYLTLDLPPLAQLQHNS